MVLIVGTENMTAYINLYNFLLLLDLKKKELYVVLKNKLKARK
jgi:hypothetical protein